MKKLLCVCLTMVFCLALCGCRAERDDKSDAEPISVAQMWGEFLADGEYEAYTDAYTQKHDDKDLAYAVMDLNADGAEELLIQTANTAFPNTWVFVWDGTAVQLAMEKYGYSSFGYSIDRNLVKVSSDFKPFNGTGYAPFYRLSGTKMEYVFQVGEDEGQYYYSDEAGRKDITAEEQAEYMKNVIPITWTPIVSNHAQ